MLNDDQHNEVKRLLRIAREGDSWQEREHALEDASKIVGVKYIKNFVNAEGMPERSGKPRLDDRTLEIMSRGGSPYLTA